MTRRFLWPLIVTVACAAIGCSVAILWLAHQYDEADN